MILHFFGKSQIVMSRGKEENDIFLYWCETFNGAFTSMKLDETTTIDRALLRASK